MPPEMTAQASKNEPKRRPSGEAEVRAAILETAMRLLAERGPSKVSLREIAREAGVNHGLIYRFFGTRDQLLGAIIGQFIEHSMEVVERSDSVADALRDFLTMDERGRIYGRLLVLALLDGADLKPFVMTSVAFAALVDRLRSERRPNGHVPRSRGPGPGADADAGVDPRIVVTASIALILGWHFFNPYLLATAGLGNTEGQEFNDALGALLDCLLGAAGPSD